MPEIETEEHNIIFRYEPVARDVELVKELVTVTGFFNDEEIAVAGELVQERLDRGVASGYFFIFASERTRLVDEERVLGYGCYGPIPGTRSSYDIYWIAVFPAFQRHGTGKLLLEKMESLISESGGTRIYVETSMQPKYVTTRSFYERCGYELEAMLEHFYAPDDGKAIYCKTLTSEPA